MTSSKNFLTSPHVVTSHQKYLKPRKSTDCFITEVRRLPASLEGLKFSSSIGWQVMMEKVRYIGCCGPWRLTFLVLPAISRESLSRWPRLGSWGGLNTLERNLQIVIELQIRLCLKLQLPQKSLQKDPYVTYFGICLKRSRAWLHLVSAKWTYTVILILVSY